MVRYPATGMICLFIERDVCLANSSSAIEGMPVKLVKLVQLADGLRHVILYLRYSSNSNY